MLTVERLHDLLSYDAETGVFRWVKNNRGRFAKVGNVAGSAHCRGYLTICLDGRRYLAHWLAWLYVTGEWPRCQVDHINGKRDDNRFCNLREATQSQNNANTRGRLYAELPFKGVIRFKGKYRAGIGVSGRFKHLGLFSSPEEAHAAYVAAAVKYYGEFARAA